jgi:hypothetical protein
MDKKANFERRIVDLIENSYKGFAKSKAIAGALTGGGVGGALGLGDTALKHYKGDYADMEPADIAKLYASKGLTSAGLGAGVGGLLGGARGRSIKNSLVAAEKNKMRQALLPFKGNARALAAEELFDNLALAGKFNDVHALDYLKNSDSFLNNRAGKILESVGMKSPSQPATNVDDLVKSVSKFLETGDDKFLAASGLTGVEMEALKRRASAAMSARGGYGAASADLRKQFEGDVSSLIASKGGPVPGAYNFPLKTPKPLDLDRLATSVKDDTDKVYRSLFKDPQNPALLAQLKDLNEKKLLVLAAKGHHDAYKHHLATGRPMLAELEFKEWMKSMEQLANVYPLPSP